jgi:hypothetical protein
MQEQNTVINRLLLVTLVTLVLISTYLSWQRYIVREDFRSFILEEEVPNRLDIRTY